MSVKRLLLVEDDAALAELRRMQSASAEGWKDVMRGADAAMKNMQEAFDKARATLAEHLEHPLDGFEMSRNHPLALRLARHVPGQF